jgi:hypothetical protein
MTPPITFVEINKESDLILPISHTCFNQVDVPVYSCYEIFRTKMMYSIREGQAGFSLV